MKKIEKNILCIFIILCPILDMMSFIFRNAFHTNISPSTFLRPIIPTIAILYLFLKMDKKFKIRLSLIGAIYAVYEILHLLVFRSVITGSSYGGITHEAQYIINYSYMIVNLILYITVFQDEEDIGKLSKSVLIANVIYMTSILIAIVTKTSSSTYIEGMGYKGWFESGNSLGSILILSLFMTIKYIKDSKYRKIAIPTILAEGIFLCTLLGTRVGLLGFILVVILYVIVETIMTLKQKGKINKKVIAGGLMAVITIIIVVITVGSSTLQRRKHLQDIEKNIVDTEKQEQSHVTGSILEIKEKIDANTLEEGYMGQAEKQSILDLYEIANQWNIKNNDQRMQQLIYNIVLVKNQHNPIYVLLGNGHVANFRELVIEMEIPAFLFNFGVIRIYTLLYTICYDFYLWWLFHDKV
ncbi:MAG: hypothetical protein HFJ37_00805 [Clostridia bacterium]|nr:hypothetical protein [Clostridia bacterium]